MMWKNCNENKNKYNIKIIDIDNDELKEIKIDTINECNINMYYQLKDRNIYNNLKELDFITTEQGYLIRNNTNKKHLYNQNYIAFIINKSFKIDNKNCNLTRLITNYALKKSYGYYLTKNNFLFHLPLFCAKLFFNYSLWYEKDVIVNSGDKGEEYIKDKQFLKSCLIYTCLTNKNHCRTFLGSDNNMYYNELCLLQDTLADKEINLKYNNKTKLFETKDEYKLNNTDQEILNKWNLVLKEAKEIKEDINKYGLYQIEEELINKKKSDKTKIETNVTSDDENYYYGETKQEIIEIKNENNTDCSNLVSYIKELKEKLKLYYKTEIQNKLFEYELLK